MLAGATGDSRMHGEVANCSVVGWTGHDPRIRVNAICPAAKTRLMEAFIEEEPDRAKAVMDSLPLGRYGDPEVDIPLAAFFWPATTPNMRLAIPSWSTLRSSGGIRRHLIMSVSCLAVLT